MPFTVVAIIAAYNEEDIIVDCLQHLERQQVSSYLLDDGSTDATVELASRFLGGSLIGIEHLPQTTPPLFSLRRILARKQELAGELDAEWFINQDADEFRDSLWSEVNLRDAFERIDRLGWNAVDFRIFNMHPIGDPDAARISPSDEAARYSTSAEFDRVQVRAWKRQPLPVDLVRSAGHDVQFPGRRVFPLRFPMRHYPIRSRAHGTRKVVVDRLPRFDPVERADGWHVQYDRKDHETFLARGDDLPVYDPLVARIHSALANRELEIEQQEHLVATTALSAMRQELESKETDLTGARQELEAKEADLGGTRRELEETGTALAEARREIEAKEAALTGTRRELEETGTALTGAKRELEAKEAALTGARRELEALQASRSWRWTSPLRKLLRPLVER